MATVYHYSGFTATGDKAAGSFKAEDERVAREDLKRRGIILTSLIPEGSARRLFRGEFAMPGSLRESQMLFFRTFAMLARAGKPTDAALAIAAKRAKSQSFRESIDAIRAEMNGGASLSESLATRPRQFTALQAAIVSVGEKAGRVDEVLERIADFTEAERATSRRVTGALAYPAIVVAASVGLLTFMFTVIIPSFRTFFAQYDVELTIETRIVLAVSDLARSPFTWVALLGMVIGGVMLYGSAKRTEGGRYALDALRFKIPIVGPILAKSIVARIARLLSLLLESGVDVDEGLKIMIPVAESAVYARALQKMREDLAGGASFITAIEGTNRFDTIFIALIESGQEIGAIDQMLNKAADYYDEDVTAALNVLSASLQPILLGVLGLVVLVLAIGVYLPLYQLVSNVH